MTNYRPCVFYFQMQYEGQANDQKDVFYFCDKRGDASTRMLQSHQALRGNGKSIHPTRQPQWL